MWASFDSSVWRVVVIVIEYQYRFGVAIEHKASRNDIGFFIRHEHVVETTVAGAVRLR